jgi:hypothetical protein
MFTIYIFSFKNVCPERLLRAHAFSEMNVSDGSNRIFSWGKERKYKETGGPLRL